ncbi:hypothetical protein SPLC1_S131580 [Arthrospira platensis C1]|nr:hypothetical protein SPLC1_S131580 [Arthrospira platensis C1]
MAIAPVLNRYNSGSAKDCDPANYTGKMPGKGAIA